MTARQEQTTAKMDAGLAEMKDGQKEMVGNQKVTEANPEKMEANSDGMASVAVHEKVPKEEAAVKSFGESKKQRGVWHLAVKQHREPKDWTQGNCESWKKFGASCRWMTCHAGVAWHKENIIKNRTRYNMEQRAC
jgi:hypothetical protein